jgi:hypothetical protein
MVIFYFGILRISHEGQLLWHEKQMLTQLYRREDDSGK